MNNEQSPALRQAVENMATMREAYNNLSQASEAYNTGKLQLAASISAMGVPANETDSLAEMATKVRSIPQQVNTRASDFEQMIAPYPYIWNVYIVATELMQNEIPSYIPSYMAEYRSRYGANSFFVGEYYLGYTTLELTGADGYLTCDGDFYTIADGLVTHTSPDGTIETYKAESIIHTWHDVADSMANRWVAFFYLDDAYSFTNITSSICPRRVALCGICNSFIVSGENRLTDVWVIGTLGHFEGGATGNTWNPAQVIRNYRSHSSGTIYTSPSNVNQIILTDTEEISGSAKVIDNNFKAGIMVIAPAMKNIFTPLVAINSTNSYRKNLSIYVDNAEYIPNGVVSQSQSNDGTYATIDIYVRNKKVFDSNEKIFVDNSSQTQRLNLNLHLDGAEEIKGSLLTGNIASYAIVNLTLHMAKVKEITGNIYYNNSKSISTVNIKNCIFPSLLRCSSRLLGRGSHDLSILADSDIEAPLCEVLEEFENTKSSAASGVLNWATSNCKKVYTPSLKRFGRIATCSYGNIKGGDDVIDWWVGEMETNLNLSQWRASNVISNVAKTRTLLANLRSHIYERISDRSNTTALTVSFGFKSVLDNYSAGTEEENAEIIAAWTQLKSDFTNNKNWNVA